MNHTLFLILESIIFVIALSTDAFIASLAYGNNKSKIPFSSMQVIAGICTGFLGVSLLLGVAVRPYISAEILIIFSFIILFFMGIFKLLDNIIKTMIEKHSINKEIKFSLFNLKFILNVYADPKEADIDESKILSPREALLLAVALSIDNLTAGVGAALGNVNVPATIVFSLLLSMAAIKSGELLGNKISEKSPLKLSWLSGILLISLAFFKLTAKIMLL